MYTERKRPYTVTRGLPHYVIGKDYHRLLRYMRELDHAYDRHSMFSHFLIYWYCEKLYTRLYHKRLPS